MKRSIIKIWILVLALLSMISCRASTEYNITYRVTGTCDDVSVSYTKDDGEDYNTYFISYIALPWEESFEVYLDQEWSEKFHAVLIAEKNIDDDSELTIQLYVDDELEDEDTTIEPYGVVEIRKRFSYKPGLF